MMETKGESGAHLSVWLAAQRNRKPMLFLVLVLALLGVWAYFEAPESIFPQVSFSRVEIFVWAGDLPPEEMHATITRPLEAALQALPVVRDPLLHQSGDGGDRARLRSRERSRMPICRTSRP